MILSKISQQIAGGSALKHHKKPDAIAISCVSHTKSDNNNHTRLPDMKIGDLTI